MGLSGSLTGLADPEANGGSSLVTKMKIVVETKGGDTSHRFSNWTSFEVMFNPATLIQTTGALWVDPAVPPPSETSTVLLNQFRSWPLDTLTFDLHFDTTEPVGGGDPVDDPDDVRGYTARVVNLVRMDPELHRPPLCQIIWGPGSPGGKVLFVGHASRITQNLLYFSAQGRPLRAKLSCAFTQWIPPIPDGSTEEAHSADVHKIYVVNPGDTLASIARSTLHDDALWRPIAVANRITDPLDLRPGRVLLIPTLNR